MQRHSPREVPVPEVNEWRFVIASYVITWLVLLGYTVRLARVRRRAAALLEESASTLRTER